jgi:hypothetical protein
MVFCRAIYRWGIIMSETVKVVEFVEIEAPREDVYDTIVDCTLRLQLSPLWGLVEIDEVSPQFPEEGSYYVLKPRQSDEPPYQNIVTSNNPPSKLSYELVIDRETCVSWELQDTPRGTRLVYEEKFIVSDHEKEDMPVRAREMIREWLTNIKRYSELRGTRTKIFIKWILDKHFLKLRREQRNTILTILFLHVVGAISFVMSAIALGIAFAL